MLPCRACQVAVGTPGRVCALLESGALLPERIAVLVLDEADSLLSGSFAEDVEWVHGVLPRRKQVRMLDKGYHHSQQFLIGVHKMCAASRYGYMSSKDSLHAWPSMLPYLCHGECAAHAALQPLGGQNCRLPEGNSLPLLAPGCCACDVLAALSSHSGLRGPLSAQHGSDNPEHDH